MSLTSQVYAYSIATDAFYEPMEQYYHKRLLKLYSIRSNYQNKKKKKKNGKRIKKAPEYTWRKESLTWKKSAINRVIAAEKSKLSALLDERVNDSTPRQLNPEALKPKNVISLFESSTTRAFGLRPNELTDTNISVLEYKLHKSSKFNLP